MKAKEKTAVAPLPVANDFAAFNVPIRRQRLGQREPGAQHSSVVVVIAMDGDHRSAAHQRYGRVMQFTGAAAGGAR